MEKLQILFPEPQLKALRGIAKRDDRPVSELVRAAVSLWITRYGAYDKDYISEAAPVYQCGDILADADQFREISNNDRNKL